MSVVAEHFLENRVTLWPGDCLDILAALDADSIDSCVTDPPYHLTSIVKRFSADNAAPAKVGKTGAYARASSGFMGKKWDGGDIAFQPETWAAVFRVLKPGAHLIAFGGTRTYHRMACAIEDAGFEVRDTVAWLYGSGFPKSHDVSKGIDRAVGAYREIIGLSQYADRGRRTDNTVYGEATPSDREVVTAPATEDARKWQGFGTALKPAFEPIIVARKPIEGTVASNVLKWGVGGLNIDGCRIGYDGEKPSAWFDPASRQGVKQNIYNGGNGLGQTFDSDPSKGRWPANVIHDGSDEVVRAFPESSITGARSERSKASTVNGTNWLSDNHESREHTDSGSAARFFYTAKADADDRLGSKHPTVKPLDLMQYLVRLVTPKGGTVIDPFAGTGTTGEAAFREGIKAILIEREEEYQNDIRRRMALVMSGPDERSRESIKAGGGDKPFEAGTLFASEASA